MSNWNYPEDLIEAAWGLIANATGGDWNEADKLSPGWKQAAEEWREAYHENLKVRYPSQDQGTDMRLERPESKEAV